MTAPPLDSTIRQDTKVSSGSTPATVSVSTNRSKEATMTTKLVALVLLCLMTGTTMAQEAKVTPLMSKDLAEYPG